MTAAKEPKAWRFLVCFVQCAAFTTVEVWAITELDGLLVWLLAAIAAWNVALLTLGLIGVSQMAAEHAKAQKQ